MYECGLVVYDMSHESYFSVLFHAHSDGLSDGRRKDRGGKSSQSKNNEFEIFLLSFYHAVVLMVMLVVR